MDVHEVVVPYGVGTEVRAEGARERSAGGFGYGVVTAGVEDGMDGAEAPVTYLGGRGKSWLRYLQRAWVQGVGGLCWRRRRGCGALRGETVHEAVMAWEIGHWGSLGGCTDWWWWR